MACLLEDGLEVMFSQVLELNEIKIFLLEIVINVPAYFTLLWLGCHEPDSKMKEEYDSLFRNE